MLEEKLKGYGEEIDDVLTKSKKRYLLDKPSIFGRLLEETVELALAGGLSVLEIKGHVADAIHNECKKNNLYPSQMKRQIVIPEEVIKELGDVFILLAFAVKAHNIKYDEIVAYADFKIRDLSDEMEKGNLQVNDKGLFYRKSRLPGGKNESK